MNSGIVFNSDIYPLSMTPDIRKLIRQWGRNPDEINTITIPLGATQYTNGVFLFDFKGFSRLSNASSNQISITMATTDQTGATTSYNDNLYLHRVETLHESAEGLGLYLAHFVDTRRYKLGALMSYGGMVSMTAPGNRNQTIGGKTLSMTSFISSVAAAWGGNLMGEPESGYNAIDWADSYDGANEPAATVLDRLAKLSGLVVSGDLGIYGYKSSELGKILNSEPNTGTGSYTNKIFSGGHTWDPNNGIGQMVPGFVNVVMPSAGDGGYSDAGSQSLLGSGCYAINIASPINPSNPNYYETIYDNFWVQAGPISPMLPAVYAAATARAQFVADAFYRPFKTPLGRWRLKGWQYNPKWLANVRLFLSEDGLPITEIWIEASDITNIAPGRKQIIQGNGGIHVAQSADGAVRLSAMATPFMAQITGSKAEGMKWTYSWIEVEPGVTTGNPLYGWPPVSQGRVGTNNAINIGEANMLAAERIQTYPVPAYQIVRMWGPYYYYQVGGDGYIGIYLFAPSVSDYPRIASVAQDGGSGGSVGVPASWTYTAMSFDGTVTYGVKMTPMMQRDTWVKGAAKIGIVYPNSGVALVPGEPPQWALVWCDEATYSNSTC